MKVGLLVMKNLVESGSMESPPPLAISKRNIEKRQREREREREKKKKRKRKMKLLSLKSFLTGAMDSAIIRVWTLD
jgi:hypothetical protein